MSRPPALPVAASVDGKAWRARRLSGVGVLLLSSIAVGVTAALLAGDPRPAVVREAVPNLLMALALGGRCWWPGARSAGRCGRS